MAQPAGPSGGIHLELHPFGRPNVQSHRCYGNFGRIVSSGEWLRNILYMIFYFASTLDATQIAA